MSDIEIMVLTSCFTIITGVVVFVIGQLLSKLIIEPAYELRKSIGEVRFNLAFHAPCIHTPAARNNDTSEQARNALMKSSCDLLAKLQAIPLYDRLSALFKSALPPRANIENAAVQLRGLSTYVFDTSSNANHEIEIINKRVALIEKSLCLTPLE